MADQGSDTTGELIGSGFGFTPILPGGVNAAALRQKLHNLSNAMTGLIGNLELVEMSTEDPEIDLVSLNTAMEAARDVMQQVRQLKFDLELELNGMEATS
jgi:hypothetical protein